MTIWHDDARFDVFTICDVYIEDNGYLYVEDQAFDYHGNYNVNPYEISEQANGESILIRYDTCGADNDYICTLEQAPFDIAKRIILNELRLWKRHTNQEEADIIQNAIEDLEEHTEEEGKFIRS